MKNKTSITKAHDNIREIKISLCTTGRVTMRHLRSFSRYSIYLTLGRKKKRRQLLSISRSNPAAHEASNMSMFQMNPLLPQPFSLICIFVACLCEPLAAKKASKSVGVSGARPWRITNVWNPIQLLNSGGPELAGGSWGSFTLVKDSNSLRLLGSTNNLTEAKDLWVFQREL